MADSLTEVITNLLRRVSRHLNRKISEILVILFNHKSAGSLGAIAGFAVAIIFTWKLLKSSNTSQRNQRKRNAAPSTRGNENQTNRAMSTSELSHLTPDLNELGFESETQNPYKATLGQMVKNKLNGGRKITCQLLGVIFEETNPEALQVHATVRTSVLEVLLEMAKYCDIYLMERILDDESGERALTALENAGLFKNGLIKDKVLFCSTENGRMSFVRQLEPEWHIDTNLELISQLSRFIRYELYVSPIHPSRIANNVFSSTSLEGYFAGLDQQ